MEQMRSELLDKGVESDSVTLAFLCASQEGGAFMIMVDVPVLNYARLPKVNVGLRQLRIYQQAETVCRSISEVCRSPSKLYSASKARCQMG
jgi:hypothetical protein